ncbi:MAG: D-alanine--D-alanine ligase [Chloroflexi bacterium]|nr:D-alanine--D-alanine ligase [Chloroflexota bacterium]
MAKKLRVAVIFGGRSGEHEISLLSAESVINAIDRSKYEVVPIGITKEGSWLISGDPLKTLRARAAGPSLPSSALIIDPMRRGLVAMELDQPSKNGKKVDVVIPILHGTYGEDGTLQGLLELVDVPYVGAGVLASSVGMDKSVMKAVFAYKGIPTIDFVMVKKREWERDAAGVIGEVETRIGYPCFVKPACLGSSVGISKAHSRAELGPALRLASAFDRKIVVEKSAENCREIEVSVLGNDEPIASVPGEIIPCNEFYDYRAKYIDQGSQLMVPARLPKTTIRTVRQLAIEAFKALDCAGMARVDFFVARDGEQVLVNEINTIPGFTSISMYPRLWAATGISFGELIDRLIELAIERHMAKAQLRTSYELEQSA